MKKYIALAAVVTLMSVGYLKAEEVGIPQDTRGNSLQSAVYGGVDISTSEFTLSSSSIKGSGVVYGVLFSSGNCTDFVIFRDSDATEGFSRPENSLGRLYNVAAGTSPYSGTPGVTTCVGFSGFPYPVRFYKGLVWAPNVNTYNSVSVLFHKNGNAGDKYGRK